MIRNFVDILKGFVDKEAEILKKQKIKHPGMIGQMFEGLTSNFVKKLSVDVFEKLDVRTN
jgi:hypothetical protein